MQSKQAVYDTLDALHIHYKVYEHPPVYTVDDVDKLSLEFEGTGCKNLFLKDNKGKKHFLVVLEDHKRVDLNLLSKNHDLGRIGFASENRLMKYLGLLPGSVSPFGIINDTNAEVIVIVDKALLSEELLTFHPNINTATVELKTTDFVKFLESRNNTVFYWTL
ncbi:prolyl-tRNA synthetase associated domain-containing protein [Fusibacter ferrireducens]|uniref:Prolyl-tRNA synthetase associated domain-containing protein n=1 Tax=Fusibacter ferrireducens TaxID=2785058 RepID=A0ABR9ZMY7_9FIRM|nr:prolyl-tRNA synthetase associated domain-containing protein [Fusibacter ferrireducens]MBF4691799.1 prolyl-tRNA synthetase associated domain-containing protein [Fusibacter ferrireducens]